MDAAHLDERLATAGRHIILMDLDGALLDSGEQHALAWQEALSAAGARPAHEEILFHNMRHGPDVMPPLLTREHLRTYGEAVRAMYQAIYVRAYLPTVRPRPEAIELVHDLKMQGLRVAITSAGRAETMATVIERFDLRSWVNVAVAVDKSEGTPADGYRLALVKLDAAPEQAIVVGATFYSLRPAQRLGLPCIAVGPPQPACEDWTEAGATMAFPSYTELRATLRHLLPTSAPDAWLPRPKDGQPLVPIVRQTQRRDSDRQVVTQRITGGD
jgi:pyrophosphatase PpaX